jgi:hypothetical protein
MCWRCCTCALVRAASRTLLHVKSAKNVATEAAQELHAGWIWLLYMSSKCLPAFWAWACVPHTHAWHPPDAALIAVKTRAVVARSLNAGKERTLAYHRHRWFRYPHSVEPVSGAMLHVVQLLLAPIYVLGVNYVAPACCGLLLSALLFISDNAQPIGAGSTIDRI